MSTQGQVPISVLVVCILATATVVLLLFMSVTCLTIRSRRKQEEYNKAQSVNLPSPPMLAMPYVIDLERSYSGNPTPGEVPAVLATAPAVPPAAATTTAAAIAGPSREDARGMPRSNTAPRLGESKDLAVPSAMGGRRTPLRELPGCTTWSKADVTPPAAAQLRRATIQIPGEFQWGRS